MSANNPSITASDIISDVESRLGSPSVSTSVYLPWVSYGYIKTFNALLKTDQEVKERLFGAYGTYTLTNGTAEYSLNTMFPRFGGPIKFEILYGDTGDQRTRLKRLPSVSHWDNQGNVSTSYRSKTDAVYYLIGDTIGIIPTPPSTDASNAILYSWYIQRPYQITGGTDVIDIPYRFLYPLVSYVQAKAIQKVNEDYRTAAAVEAKFDQDLMEIADAAASERNENDGISSIEYSSNSPLLSNPLRDGF